MYLSAGRLQAEHSSQSHCQSPRERHLVRLQSVLRNLGRRSKALARGCTPLAVKRHPTTPVIFTSKSN